MKMVIYDSRFLAGEVGKGVFATAHEGAAQYCRKVDKREIPVCPILGVNIAVINMNWLLKYLAQNIHQLQGDYICVSNVHTTVVSYEDADYRAVQNGGLMAIPDGNPLAQEARRRGYPQIQRTTGPDLMMEVFRQSTAHGWRHYFYGSTQEVQEKMITRLQQEYPGLVIAGTDAPPFRELTPEEDALAVARINQAQPDFVWVGLGAPKQERWMAAHQGRVHGLMIGVGAGFDFFSGNVKRAPLWMQKHSLEWLYRLMQDPKRLFQRYWSTNLKFIWNAASKRQNSPLYCWYTTIIRFPAARMSLWRTRSTCWKRTVTLRRCMRGGTKRFRAWERCRKSAVRWGCFSASVHTARFGGASAKTGFRWCMCTTRCR